MRSEFHFTNFVILNNYKITLKILDGKQVVFRQRKTDG